MGRDRECLAEGEEPDGDHDDVDASRERWAAGEVDVPVTIGNVTVAPGEWVFGAEEAVRSSGPPCVRVVRG